MLANRDNSKRSLAFFVSTVLAVELLDELVDGAWSAAWPLVRDDLGLSYAEIGLLLSVPALVANLLEPLLGVLGDVWRRRALVLGGGVAFALSLALTGLAPGYGVLLASLVLFYPASGAFVSLSQGALMDREPHRREQNMARWEVAGSVGNLAGPPLIGLAVALGLGWRGAFLGLAALAGLALAAAWRLPFASGQSARLSRAELVAGLRGALGAVRRPLVARLLALLEGANLMLDVLRGFAALYLVDVAGLPPGLAALGLALYSGCGLLGDLLLVGLLERVLSLRYLRWSVPAVLALYLAFLLTPGAGAKLALLGLLGALTTGWYAILKGRLYAALHGQSGTVMAVDSVAGMVGGLVPLALGLVAEGFGLTAAMWLLLLGPLSLLVGLPRETGKNRE